MKLSTPLWVCYFMQSDQRRHFDRICDITGRERCVRCSAVNLQTFVETWSNNPTFQVRLSLLRFPNDSVRNQSLRFMRWVSLLTLSQDAITETRKFFSCITRQKKTPSLFEHFIIVFCRSRFDSGLSCAHESWQNCSHKRRCYRHRSRYHHYCL
jgi:hypothetical protein